MPLSVLLLLAMSETVLFGQREGQAVLLLGEKLKQKQPAAQTAKQEMSAGKRNWLAKQKIKETQASSAFQEGVNALMSRSTESSASSGNSKARCASHVNTSELGEWRRLADGTSVFNMHDCEIWEPTGQEARDCLRNTHIIFIGDSLTRYQYLSLVHLLANGSFADRRIVFDYDIHKEEPEATRDHFVNRGHPNILREHDFLHHYHHHEDGKWEDKFLWESNLFGGNERCDCWRGNRTYNSDTFKEQLENRYYSDGSVHVTYLQSLGVALPPRGHSEEIKKAYAATKSAEWRKDNILTTETYAQHASDQWPYDWASSNVSQAVERVLSAMPLRNSTRHIVLWNEGIWNEGAIDNRVDDLKQLMESVGDGGKVFWKTTTVNHLGGGWNESYLQYDSRTRAIVRELQEQAATDRIGLFDTAAITADFQSFAKMYTPAYMEKYWDACHFQPYVYNEITKVILNQVMQCPSTAPAPAGGASWS
jgi:hypothetical protein